MPTTHTATWRPSHTPHTPPRLNTAERHQHRAERAARHAAHRAAWLALADTLPMPADTLTAPAARRHPV